MEDTLAKKLEHAHSWFNEHCRELYQRIHDDDRAAALRQLAQVRNELPKSGLAADEISYLDVRLRYVQLQVQKMNLGAEEGAALRAALLAELGEPCATELAAAAQRVLRIQLYAQMLRDGEAEYPVAQFREDYQRIPSELYTSELSLYAASVAYLHGEVQILEKIFIDFTLNPGVFQTSFVWQALNLMYQMATQKASSRDAEETIKVLQHIRHWQFIEKLVWRDLVARGLIDKDVEEQLQHKLAELEAEVDHSALTSRRVRRARMS